MKLAPNSTPEFDWIPKNRRQEIEPLEGPKAGVGKLAEVQFPRWWFQRFVIQFD